MNKFNDNDIRNEFTNASNISEGEARAVLRDENKIMQIVRKYLGEYAEIIKLYFRMSGDFFSGKYKQVPIGTILAIAGSLAYILCPVDLINDAIIGIGFTDDIAVLKMCMKFTKIDVENYKRNMGIV